MCKYGMACLPCMICLAMLCVLALMSVLSFVLSSFDYQLLNSCIHVYIDHPLTHAEESSSHSSSSSATTSAEASAGHDSTETIYYNSEGCAEYLTKYFLCCGLLLVLYIIVVYEVIRHTRVKLMRKATEINSQTVTDASTFYHSFYLYESILRKYITNEDKSQAKVNLERITSLNEVNSFPTPPSKRRPRKTTKTTREDTYSMDSLDEMLDAYDEMEEIQEKKNQRARNNFFHRIYKIIYCQITNSRSYSIGAGRCVIYAHVKSYFLICAYLPHDIFECVCKCV